MQLNERFAPVLLVHRIGEFIVRPVRTAIQDIAYYNSYGRACIQPYIKRAQHRIPHGPNPKYPECVMKLFRAEDGTYPNN